MRRPLEFFSPPPDKETILGGTNTSLLLKYLVYHHMASRSPRDLSDGSFHIPLFFPAAAGAFRECGGIHTSVTHCFRAAFKVCLHSSTEAALCLFQNSVECWPTHLYLCKIKSFKSHISVFGGWPWKLWPLTVIPLNLPDFDVSHLASSSLSSSSLLKNWCRKISHPLKT